MESPPGAETTIDGRRYVYFGGTGYLGLAGHPEVIEAACAAARRYGVHTATSRNGFGSSPPLVAAEREAAAFFDTETAFHYASGFAGNHILVQAAAGTDRNSLVCLDRTVHFSAREAARLVAAEVMEFEPGDPENLANAIRRKARPAQPVFVMTDGVSPVTGAVAPLRDYLAVCREYPEARLVVDDAHGFGVLGDEGRGTVEWWGLWAEGVNGTGSPDRERLLLCGTLSKALGGFGGLIPASTRFLDQLRRNTHYYEGASAPAAPIAAAAARALAIVRARPELRRRLAANVLRLRRGLRALGLPVPEGPAANLGLAIGSREAMIRLHAALKTQGFLVPHLEAYPGAGPEGVLRFAVCATHSDAMIDALLAALRRLL